MKLKHFATSTAGGTPDTSNVAFWSDDEAGTPWVAIGDMSGRDLVTVTQKKLTTAGLLDRRLRPAPAGTVLFAMYASVGEVSTLAIPAVWNQAILGLTPLTGMADSRFLAYWLRHFAPQAIAQANSATQANLGADQVMNFPFPDLTIPGQRRIADFLDDRVARIDQIIVARQRQHDMVDLEAAALLPRALTVRGQAPLSGPDVPTTGWAPTEGWRVAPLGRLLVQLTNGFVGPTRDILTEEGVRYIQGTHIKHGSIDFQRHPYYVREDWARSRPRILLRPKDILLVQTGAIGEVAMVPDDFGEASCHALLIARTNRDVADPTYLTEYLRSSSGQAALLARATGALHPHLEFGIKSAPILLPRLEVQREVAAEVQTLRAQVSGATESITASIALLQEYKQSLITAAVTGEFDVTTASTRIPE